MIVMDKVTYVFELMLNFCLLQVSPSLVLSCFQEWFLSKKKKKEAGLKICAL